MKSEAVVKSLAALAHPSRLEVFRLLVRRGPEGYPPGDMAHRLDIPAPTLSFHLKELAQAGLVEFRRDGRFLFYSANMNQMNTLLSFLTENCCSLGTFASVSCKPAASTRLRKSAC